MPATYRIATVTDSAPMRTESMPRRLLKNIPLNIKYSSFSGKNQYKPKTIFL